MGFIKRRNAGSANQKGGTKTLYQTSQAYRQAVKQSGRKWHGKAEIQLANGKTLSLGDDRIMAGGIQISEGTSAPGSFDLGCVSIAELSLEINNFDGEYSATVFTGATVTPYAGLELADGATEWIPLGVFLVDEAPTSGAVIQISALDTLVKTEIPYSQSNLTYPATLKQIYDDCLSMCGLKSAAATFYNQNYSVPERPNDESLTVRDVLAYVAELACCYVRADRAGKVRMSWYDTSAPADTLQSLASCQSALSDAVITGVKYTHKDRDADEETTILVGTDVYAFTLSDNPLLQANKQATLDGMGKRLIGLAFRDYQCSSRLADPSLEAGDAVTVTPAKGSPFVSLITELTYTIGECEDFTCSAPTELESKSSRYSAVAKLESVVNENINAKYARLQEVISQKVDTQQLTAATARIQNLEADTATLKDAVVDVLHADDLTAVNADIQALRAADATINKALVNKLEAKDLTAVNGSITNLKADVADLQALTADVAHLDDLTAANARIDQADIKIADINKALVDVAHVSDLTAVNGEISNLKTTTADISSLLAGEVTAGSSQTIHLTAKNTTIDNAVIKNAMVDSLQADKLTSGTLNTGKVTVQSGSGNLQIADNTLKITDGTRTRVQLGKDAGGDYSLSAWDASGNLMWDARGAKAAAIKDKIIRDDMISDSANISGGKLNIPSVVTQINKGTSSIQSSKINYDPTGQTLNVALNSLTERVEENAGLSQSNSTQLDVQQGQISTLISNTTVQKDGKTVQLKDAYNSTVQTVEGIQTTIGRHQTTIDQNTEQIQQVESSTASLRSDLNGFSATLGNVSKLTQAHSGQIATVTQETEANTTAITAMQGKIDLKVEESDIIERIGALQIGGRNLIRNGDFSQEPDQWTATDSVTFAREGNCLKVTCGVGQVEYALPGLFVKGEAYTLSLSMNASIAMPVELGQAGKVFGTAQVATAKKRFVFSFTAASANTLYIRPSQANRYLYLYEVKLERGDKATDWTPAPEDTVDLIETSVDAAKAAISVDIANGVTARVERLEQNTSETAGEITALQSRLSTAEQKITTEAITNVVSNRFYDKGEATEKFTRLEQTVDGLTATASSSGGSNLLLGTAAFDTHSWTYSGAVTALRNQSDIVNNTESGGAFQLGTGFMIQTVRTLPGTSYCYRMRYRLTGTLTSDASLTVDGRELPLDTLNQWVLVKGSFVARGNQAAFQVENKTGTLLVADMILVPGLNVVAWQQGDMELQSDELYFANGELGVGKSGDPLRTAITNSQFSVKNTATNQPVIYAGVGGAELDQTTVRKNLTVQAEESASGAFMVMPIGNQHVMFVIND